MEAVKWKYMNRERWGVGRKHSQKKQEVNNEYGDKGGEGRGRFDH